jgi:hypothetical protein
MHSVDIASQTQGGSARHRVVQHTDGTLIDQSKSDS